MILIRITQNVESQDDGYKKTKHVKFSKNRTFLTLWYANARKKCSLCVSGSKKFSFFRKFGVLCLFVTAVLRLVLLPYFQRLLGNDVITDFLQRDSVSEKFWLHVFHKTFWDTTKKCENKNLKPSLLLSLSAFLINPIKSKFWKHIQKLKGTWSFLFFLIQVLSNTPFYLSKLKFCTCAKHYFSNDLERIKR